MQITRGSVDTRKQPKERFTGDVYADHVAESSPGSSAKAAFVHFSPGARTGWHAHPRGQTIYITEGICHCQRRGGPVEILRAGEGAFFEPEEEHWHGAAPSRFMTHLAIGEVDEHGVSAVWGELVTDAEYSAAPPAEA
jgi:quercetin dioxygenase-like cupin family protein